MKKLLNIYSNNQQGFGNGWVLLTLGLMVGFIVGFVLFLSGMPEEHYTLIDTETAVEQYKSADASEFEFYDRLNKLNTVVPKFEGENMPAFSNEDRRVQTAQTDKQSAVELAADLIARADEGQAVEVAASSAKTGSNLVSAAAGDPLVRTTPVKQKTIVRKIPNNPNTAYYLQAGAFTNNNDANRMQDQLVSAGMDAFVKSVAVDGKQWHRVRIGPFYDSESLYTAQTRLGRSGISYLVIKVQS